MRRNDWIKIFAVGMAIGWAIMVVVTPVTRGDEFTERLNGVRIEAGLPPVGVDASAIGIAHANNAAQRIRGLGHHITGNLWQCANVGCGDVTTTLASWLNSPPHRSIIMNPALAAVAYANDGYYATVACQMSQAVPASTAGILPSAVGVAACYRRGFFGRLRCR